MNHNRYAPPQAVVADVVAGDTNIDNAPLFFPCSLLKLAVMSVSTLGLYHIYWFYKNWRCIKDRTGEEINPAARSIFAIFFCYDLFKRIRAHQDSELRKPLAAGLLTTVFILMSFSARLPYAFWCISLLSFLPLLPVQREVNQINRVAAPDHDSNSRFTAANWTLVVLGIIIIALVIIGTYTTEATLINP